MLSYVSLPDRRVNISYLSNTTKLHRASLICSVVKEFTCNAGDPSSIPGLGRSSGERKGYSLQYLLPCGSTGKESTHNAGDLGSISGLGRSPGEGNSYPLQYSGQENSMDCIVHEVAKS